MQLIYHNHYTVYITAHCLAFMSQSSAKHGWIAYIIENKNHILLMINLIASFRNQAEWKCVCVWQIFVSSPLCCAHYRPISIFFHQKQLPFFFSHAWRGINAALSASLVSQVFCVLIFIVAKNFFKKNNRKNKKTLSNKLIFLQIQRKKNAN